MAWSELQLIALPRPQLVSVSQALFALGAAGLQEDHAPGEAPAARQPWDSGPEPAATPRVLLRAWFEDPDRQAVEAHLASVGVELRWAEVPETDWDAQWRATFTPITISERLVVAPPWDAPPGALVIEPGQGFGTGDHPTTRQALRAVDHLAPSCATALDVGCGSGVLALAAARLGASVRGIDVEEAAIRDAQRNATRNGLVAAFSTHAIEEVSPGAQLILANLHAELIVRLAPHLIRLTETWLVLAGILADRESSVRTAMGASLTVVHREQDGEWVSLRLRHGVSGAPP